MEEVEAIPLSNKSDFRAADETIGEETTCIESQERSNIRELPEYCIRSRDGMNKKARRVIIVIIVVFTVISATFISGLIIRIYMENTNAGSSPESPNPGIRDEARKNRPISDDQKRNPSSSNHSKIPSILEDPTNHQKNDQSLSTEEIVTASSTHSTKLSDIAPTNSRNLETHISTVKSATTISNRDPARAVSSNTTTSYQGQTTVTSTTIALGRDTGTLTTSSEILDRGMANTVTTTSTISSNDNQMTVTSTTTLFNRDDGRTSTNNSTMSNQGVASTITSTTTVYSRDMAKTVTTNEVTFTDMNTADENSVSSVVHETSRSEYAISSSTEQSDIVEIVSTDAIKQGDRLESEVTTMREITSKVVSPSSTAITKDIPATKPSDSATSTDPAKKTMSEHHVFFVDGEFTCDQAHRACGSKKALVATKRDLDEAWEAGFSRCTYGWLHDKHVAMVTQSPNERCHKTDVGVLYSESPQNCEDKFQGVYCINGAIDILSKDDKLSIGTGMKSINWWVTVHQQDAYDLQYILTSVSTAHANGGRSYPLLKYLHSIYICCNAFNITHTAELKPRTYVQERHPRKFFEASVNLYRQIFGSTKVLTHVYCSYEAMMVYGAATTNRSAIIRQIVTSAVEIGLDGLIINYEPKLNYSRDHANTYIQFLNDFSDAAEKHGISIGTVISSWGILKHYDLFAKSKLEVFGSMGSTYYGRDVDRNKDRVNEMLEEFDTDRLQVGLGLTMAPAAGKLRREYYWDETKLKDFVTWLRDRGIKHLHIYPERWRRHRYAEQYFVDTLAMF